MRALRLLLLPAVLFAADPSDLESRAGSGDASAQFELARVYLLGSDGRPRDLQRAYGLMKSAAAAGHQDAIGGVGYFFANGIAVGKDDAEAARWFRKGADAGSAKARLNFGKALLEGRGLERDEREGLRWIRMTAQQGQPDAALCLGMIFFFGEHGQKAEPALAFPYLLIAAERGLPAAQNMVGVMLENGQGTEMDAAGAEEWYRKAARQGHLKAQSSLGRLIGPEVQERERRLEALAWLVVASTGGEVTAQRMLEEIAAGISLQDQIEARSLADDLRKSLREEPPRK